MRALLALLFLALLGGAAQAQRQEDKLADRVLKPPDQTLNYDLRKSTFGSDRSFVSSSATVKNFTLEQHYFPKAFESKAFLGASQPWAGNFKFSTTEAPTRKFAEADTSRMAAVKAVAVNDSQYAGKSMPIKTSEEAGRGFFGKGRSQDQFDSDKKKGITSQTRVNSYDGELKPMTIDEIRTLLNKNK